MIVASTIVPVATFSPFAAKCRCTSSLAQIVRFEQMTEAAHRRLVGHRFAAEVDADKMPHGRRIIERLFHRRVRQIGTTAAGNRYAASARPRPAGGHCPAWDRIARSARTAPTTAQCAPSRQEILPAASFWRSAQTQPPYPRHGCPLAASPERARGWPALRNSRKTLPLL